MLGNKITELVIALIKRAEEQDLDIVWIKATFCDYMIKRDNELLSFYRIGESLTKCLLKGV